MTVSDRLVEDRARAFHIGDAPPATFHYIDARSSDAPDENGTY
ncbi:MAG TPA: hypothetical protein VGW77_15940 [Candidatus Binatia bacterium]|nr:hypothetical protein [Candidatus Binatia bacterium]